MIEFICYVHWYFPLIFLFSPPDVAVQKTCGHLLMNKRFHENLGIRTIEKEIVNFSSWYLRDHHANSLLIGLLDDSEESNKLERYILDL